MQFRQGFPMTASKDSAFRPPEQRRQEDLSALAATLLAARDRVPFWAARLPDPAAAQLTPERFAQLPVLRKSELPALQAAMPPFGGLAARPAGQFPRLFLSPGPICEPGGTGSTGAEQAMHAAGVVPGDVVLNTFGYHLTPAGLMFDDAARAVGAAVIPAGGGNTEQILLAMRAFLPTVYVGTPDYLNILIEAADRAGIPLTLRVALLSGAALPASLRAAFTARGIGVFELYGTAELGIIAYETASHDGMVVNENLWVEIVAPGSGDLMPPGEIGELVVTPFRSDYPLIRFATGDLTALLPGFAASGHTNHRLRGWLGRADDTVKVKGMFMRPAMLAEVLAGLPDPVPRARFVIDRAEERDRLVLEIEGNDDPGQNAILLERVRAVARLGCELRWVAKGSLPEGPALRDLRPAP